MRDGKARTVSVENSLPLFGSNGTHEPSTFTSFKIASADQGEATTHDFKAPLNHIRRSLYFERLLERQEVIKDAHYTTFHWIFQDEIPSAKVDAFSSFPQWLAQGHGCYWIQGKAGSGKSTLVKRIHEHEQTRHHLEQWSGDMELLTASFFFWYMGHSLQKTVEGMLRSLLHGLLEQAPTLVLDAFPDLFIDAMSIAPESYLRPPYLFELEEGLHRLLQACEASRRFKICLFIDGLDECSDDHAELAEFLLRLGARSEMVKVVLSSRPLGAFVDMFSVLPGLRVQDLTTSDIQDYTQDLIPKDRYGISESDVSALVSIISERSQGVFLWVTVVVRSVLEGLRYGDTVSEFQDRVRRLPKELKDLYHRMLQDIDELYRPRAAETLRLVAIAFDPMHPQQTEPLIERFSALQLSFALEGCAVALETPATPCTTDEIQKRLEDLKPRLLSRCLGLLELRDCSDSFGTAEGPRSGKRMMSVLVEPFHRTAVEFLLDEEVSDLLTNSASPEFDTFDTLFCSTIRMVKASTPFAPESSVAATADLPPWYHLVEVLLLATDAIRRGRGVKQAYIDHLDYVFGVHWADWERRYAPASRQASHWLCAVLLNRKSTQGDWIGEDKQHINVDLDDQLCAELLERCSKINYICIIATIYRPDDLKLLSEPAFPLSKQDATLLLRLLIQVRFKPAGAGTFRVFFEHSTQQAMRCLLACGADPNVSDFTDPSCTLWTSFLLGTKEFFTCKSLLMPAEDGGSAFISMVEDFVAYGADLSVTLPWSGDPCLPSVFVYALYLLVSEGQNMFSGRGQGLESAFLARRFDVMKEAMGQAARFLREEESKTGIHNTFRGPKRWLESRRRLRGRSTETPKARVQDKEKDLRSPMSLVRRIKDKAKSAL
ncbi:hypothetical protein CC79DRAFT_1367123 [Sarocladium strictum]